MFVMSAFVAVLFLGTSPVLGRVFSNDEQVVGMTSKLCKILAVAYILLAVTFACFGTLQGQGRPGVAAASMVLGLWGVSVPCAWAMGIRKSGHQGLEGVWWGLVIGYGTMTALMTVVVVKSDWEGISKTARKRAEKEDGGGADDKEAGNA